MVFATLRKALMFTLFAFMAAACSKGSETGEPAVANTAPPVTPAVEAPGQENEADEIALSELAGTDWRLVRIMSMDDSTYEPGDPSVYKLSFAVDGTVNVLADCNRATGSWVSESPGQLQFGTFAATMAMCPPESLHDRYLAEFQWVRSYVMRDGHLFLATMADGSIIEFEPEDSE